MFNYPIEDVLKAMYFFENYDEAMFKKFID